MSIFLFKRKYCLLEPCEGKLSRTVLRGESTRKGADLPDPFIIRYRTSNKDGVSLQKRHSNKFEREIRFFIFYCA